MPKELPELELGKDRKACLPLGYAKIFVRKIPHASLDKKLEFYSKKYNKLDLPRMASQKPISKIVSYQIKSDTHED